MVFIEVGWRMSEEPIKSRLSRFSKKLPDSAQDEYYASKEARLDTIIGDSKTIWLQIVSAKREFDLLQIYQQTDFYKWLQEEYGVKLHLTPDGEMTLENEVLDEQKYLIFMLKHSGK